ncbi:class I adenylate-forming enzyme family protein [Afifella marina]|uniref:Crotonobetaine/carnitine-CoA ligase n=2 Tax=Hyphomicrobiales TaxID=356 RepID=A0A1G5MD60_AFIMA|nr:AMP-binding protein [Afifella marina]SCZ23105.1 crotonobetaine/carnitine-CoA ligase [Afifella marina DSM 2698]
MTDGATTDGAMPPENTQGPAGPQSAGMSAPSSDVRIHGLAKNFNELSNRVPERVFAHTPEGPLTFGELSSRADAMISHLSAQGVRAGDRVIVMMRNSPASLALIFGLMRAGMIWVPTNPALVGDGLAHAIKLVEAAIVVCDPNLVETVEHCGATAEKGILPLAGLPPAVEAASLQEPVLAPDDLVALMFTSGTTGPSKAVMVTHAMLELSAQAAAFCAGLRPGDNLYVWEPFYHIGGAQVIALPLLHDVVLTLRDRFSASRFWADVREAGCTHIHHLGGIIQILLKQPPSPLDRDHDVRIAWGGGCPADVWKAFEDRFGVEIRECYGMTESSSLTTCNTEGAVGSVGRPLPWFTVTVKDEAGKVLGAGEGRGEIIVNTSLPAAIFPGYYRNPEATAKALRDDGFHTGDLGSWNEDGLLFFHGRMGDSIRCRGENVSSHEVESVALRHPDVEECAMVGVPAEVGEYDIQLFIVRRKGSELKPDTLHDWLAGRLAPYQRPRYIAFVEEFPKTPSQRIQKHRLPQAPEGRWDSATHTERRKP